MKKETLLLPRIPVSTYRVQFNREFTFSHAKLIIPYLHRLGITDLYASPYLKAKEGSMHGYDIVNPLMFNPEIGTDSEYTAFAEELRKHGMGQILDIVPNHMCITSSLNSWWTDVLENGQSSVYAHFFDIDWNPVKKELKNKLLLPILGDQYGRVLENQELKLEFREGRFLICYYDHVFPVRPKTYLNILSHGIEELKKNLPENNPDLLDLESIITALKHLPSYTEKDRQRQHERDREKESIKKRLMELHRRSEAIREFIGQNLRAFNGEKGKPRSFDLLDKLISEQVYRLSFWRVATEEINYRRFFDINDLAAIKMEYPDVFRETHRLVMRLIREGMVTGLRVDHPDGLYNPLEYFQWLQRSCFVQLRTGHLEKVKKDIPPDVIESLQEDIPFLNEKDSMRAEIRKIYDAILSSDPSYKPFYIVGEKILIRDERMPEEWPIFSTTGYVFLNAVNGIFIKAEHAKAMDDIYSRFTRMRIHFPELIYETKKLIMQVAMASEIHMLGHYLNIISEKNRHTRDFTLNSLIAAIIEVIAFFPVYRTYITASHVHERDVRYLELAVSKAKRKNPAISGSIFDFLKDVLLLHYRESTREPDKKEWVDFTMRFQQITGPVMAKGLEDTAFYVYNRLVSLNEVGGSPERFGTSLDAFHGKNIERLKFWPHALIATATHDTKRSEDVRARINVISELPEEWRKCLLTWRRLNRKKKPVVDGQKVPDRNEEYLLYQTLAGAWPLEEMDEAGFGQFTGRIREYMLKASREAKINTSWINPNSMYEDALMVFVDAVMHRDSSGEFISDFLRFQKKISHYGMFNSLSQTLLKITSPGVPDFYQGTELWDFTLVDPDNRRAVDYRLRTAMLEELAGSETSTGLLNLSRDLVEHREDGGIKLFLTCRALHYRRKVRELFERGEYLQLEVTDGYGPHICAFARRLGTVTAVVVAPRLLTGIAPYPGTLPLGREVWRTAAVIVPFEDAGVRYTNIFTGEVITAEPAEDTTVFFLAEMLRHFPVALFSKGGGL